MFHRDRLETHTGYAIIIGFFAMLGLYCYKEVFNTVFAAPDIVIYLFGFFSSELKGISVGRGEGGAFMGKNGD